MTFAFLIFFRLATRGLNYSRHHRSATPPSRPGSGKNVSSPITGNVTPGAMKARVKGLVISVMLMCKQILCTLLNKFRLEVNPKLWLNEVASASIKYCV